MKQSYKQIVFAIILIISSLYTNNIFADGSKDLYPSGVSGKRAFLVSSALAGTSSASFPFMTAGTIKIYARVGETIYLGSSAQGFAEGSINLFAPTKVPNANRTNFDYSSGTSTTVGRILNRTQELAGPAPTANGYTPYTHTVTLAEGDGIWEIDFIAPERSRSVASVNSTDIQANANWTSTNQHQGSGNNLSNTILAWDVSVRNAPLSNTDLVNNPFISGRVYTNVFNAIIRDAFVELTDGFYGNFFVLTKDSYTYKVNANGQVGVGFTFFANNRGFTSGANGTGTAPRKSLNSATTPNVKNPREADDALNITHKLFFTKPAADLPATAIAANASTWLKVATVSAPTVSAVSITGLEGGGSQVGIKGGFVNFTSNSVGTYKITIPGGAVNRILIGSTVSGANAILWDGKSGLSAADPFSPGPALPPGTVISGLKVQQFGAEVHFPFIDVEINPRGIIIEELTTDGLYNTIPNKDKVYWDDSDITLVGNNAGATPSNPRTVLFGLSAGVSSNTNGHRFGAYSPAGFGLAEWGNNRSIDTYSFVEGSEVFVTSSVTTVAADLAVASITPSVTTVTNGSTLTYTIVIQNINTPNVSISDVTGATFGFEYPTGFSFTTANAVLTTNTGTVTATSPSITGNIFSSTLAMTSGSSATYVITGTISGATPGASFNTVRATILRPADISDPDATFDDPGSPTNGTFSNNPDTECNGIPSGAGCNNIRTSAVVLVDPSISGNVFNDTNGLLGLPLNTVDGAAYTVANVFVIAYNNSTNLVQAITPVNASGAYEILVPRGNSYTLYLTRNTSNPATINGATIPTITLPNGWVNTGENIGLTSGSDGSVNSILQIGIVNANQTNLNFGIQQIPTAGAGANIANNPGGIIQVAVPANTFTNVTASSDPTLVTGIRITSFPTNTRSIVIDGVTYNANVPADVTALILLLIPTDAVGNPAVTITLDPLRTVNSVISFNAIDAAGAKSSNIGTAALSLKKRYLITNPMIY